MLRELSQACESYFSGFEEISHYDKNDNTTNMVALLKIVANVILFPVSLLVGGVYGTARLLDYTFTKVDVPSDKEEKIEGTAKKALNLEGAGAIITRSAKAIGETLRNLKDFSLDEILTMYEPSKTPNKNLENLKEYAQSEACQRHQKSARVYYNGDQLAKDDARAIIHQREPTNLNARPIYNQNKTEELLGYKRGIYSDSSITKTDGTSFKDLPNTAMVYSETYLWNPAGTKDPTNRKEVAIFSLPAQALDSLSQPHYNYYIDPTTKKLDPDKYEEEMRLLFNGIKKAVDDNKNTAFEGKGIKRIVLTKFGQGAFLGMLTDKEKTTANDIYKKLMNEFVKEMAGEIEIVLNVFGKKETVPTGEKWLPDEQIAYGAIEDVAEEGDLIINPWDPHSAPGNGNDGDLKTVDGVLGATTSILLTQTTWLNKNLRGEDAFIAVTAATAA